MLIGPEPLDFPDALSYCDSMGSVLVSIHSAEEQAEAAHLCDTLSHNDSIGCWIGLYHDDLLGHWRWIDESDTDYGFINSSYATTGVHWSGTVGG